MPMNEPATKNKQQMACGSKYGQYVLAVDVVTVQYLSISHTHRHILLYYIKDENLSMLSMHFKVGNLY